MSPRLLSFTLAGLLGLAGPGLAQERRAWAFPPAPIKAAPKVKSVTYPVADLVVPLPMKAATPFRPLPEEVEPAAARGPDGFRAAARGVKRETKEGELIELITSTVARDSWASVGGPGEIQYYPLGMSLVITHRPEVQEEVGQVLKALRRFQDVQVVMEMRILSVDPVHLEKTARALRLNQTTDDRLRTPPVEDAAPRLILPIGPTWRAQVGAQKARQFLHLLEKHPSTSVLIAPRMTLANGQEGRLELIDSQVFTTGAEIDGDLNVTRKDKAYAVGSRLSLQPVVSADRRGVRLSVEASLAELIEQTRHEIPLPGKEGGAKISLQRPTFSTCHIRPTFTMPNGATMVLNCGVLPVQVARSQTYPLFAGVPIVDQIFQHPTLAQEERNVLIVLTPRVLVQEEEEVFVPQGEGRPK